MLRDDRVKRTDDERRAAAAQLRAWSVPDFLRFLTEESVRAGSGLCAEADAGMVPAAFLSIRWAPGMAGPFAARNSPVPAT
jgi:hypothetical protein